MKRLFHAFPRPSHEVDRKLRKATRCEPSEEDQKELLVRYLPSRRKGHPRDLVGALVYLASDACDFVTGQTIFIDGGAMAHA